MYKPCVRGWRGLKEQNQIDSKLAIRVTITKQNIFLTSKPKKKKKYNFQVKSSPSPHTISLALATTPTNKERLSRV